MAPEAKNVNFGNFLFQFRLFSLLLQPKLSLDDRSSSLIPDVIFVLVFPSFQKLAPIPVVVSQNVTNKRLLDYF